MLLRQATERLIIFIADGNQRFENLAELADTFFELLSVGRPRSGTSVATAGGSMYCWPRALPPHSEISEQRAIGLFRLRRSAFADHDCSGAASAMVRTQDDASLRATVANAAQGRRAFARR